MTFARLLVANLPATACIVAAGVLAYHERGGWGWFLFASLLFGSTAVVNQREAPRPTPETDTA